MENINKNLAFQPIIANDNDTFIGCNLMQKQPNTLICQNVKGLRFERCNLVNCLLPEDAITVDCTIVNVDLCSHLYPGVDLPTEDAFCRHVDSELEVMDEATGERRIERTYANRPLSGGNS